MGHSLPTRSSANFGLVQKGPILSDPRDGGPSVGWVQPTGHKALSSCGLHPHYDGRLRITRCYHRLNDTRFSSLFKDTICWRSWIRNNLGRLIDVSVQEEVTAQIKRCGPRGSDGFPAGRLDRGVTDAAIIVRLQARLHWPTLPSAVMAHPLRSPVATGKQPSWSAGRIAYNSLSGRQKIR
jgi:hypothetical protein